MLSPQLAKLTGYPIERFNNDWDFWSSLLHPDDRAAGEAQFARLLAGEESEVEYRIIDVNQQVFWVRDHCHVERHPDGHKLTLYGVISDITDRKQTEAALATERNLLRTVIDQLPDLIYMKDLEGHILLSNIANAIGTGVSSPEEIYGKTDFDNYPYELAARYRADEETVIRTGKPIINREEPAFHPGTERRWILTTKVPLFNAQGEITGIVGVGRNITERKEAEAALRQSEERFVKAFQAGPLPMAIVTMDEWRYVDVNDSYLKHVGYSRAEILNHTAAELALWHSSTDQDNTMELLRQRGSVRQVEGLYCNKSGDARDCIASMEIIHLADKEHVLLVFEDITERKLAEKALRRSEATNRSILTAIPDLIFRLDNEGRFLDIHTGDNQLLVASAEEMVGSTVQALLPAPIANRIIEMIQAAQATGEIQSFEPELDVLAGKRSFEARLVTISSNEVLLMARDITERKQAEAEREQLLQQMEARVNELATVAEVSLQMTTILDVEQLLWTVANLTKENFDLYHAHIYLVDKEHRQLVLAAGSSEAGKKMAASGHRILLDHHRSLVATAARSRKAVIVNNVQTEALFLPNPLLPDTCSEMAIPMIVGDTLIGILDVQADVYDRFTAEDVNVQTTLAAQIAIAINNARLFAERKQAEEALRRANRAYRALSDCNQAMVRANDETRLLQDVCQIIVDKGGYRMVWAGLVEHDEARSVRPVARAGEYTDWVDHLEVTWADQEPSSGPTGRAIRSKRLQLVPNIATEPDLSSWSTNALAHGFTSAISLPLLDSGGEAFGALTVYASDEPSFDPEEIDLLAELAFDLAFGIMGLRSNIERERAQKAEREHRLLAEVLRDIAAVINSTLDSDEVLERILTNIERVVPHTLANIMMVDHGVARVVRHRGYTEPDHERWIGETLFFIDEIPNLRQMAETKQQIVIPDTEATPDWISFPATGKIRSYAAAPIIIDGEAAGFINLDSPIPCFFNEQHAEHLQAFADQAAIALRNAQLYDAIQQHVSELETLRRVTLEITAELDLDTVLHTIVSSAVTMLQADSGGIYFNRPERDVLEWVVSVGERVGPVGHVLRRGEGISSQVWERGEARLINNYGEWEGRTRQFDLMREWTAVIAVPISWHDQRLGVFTAFSHNPDRPFSERDIYRLGLFANQAAIAIQNAQLFADEREQRAMAEALQDTAAVVNSTLDFNEVLERILENVGRVMQHETANIMLIEDGYIHVVGSRGYEKRNLENWIRQLHYPVEKAACMVQIIETGQPVIVPDTNEYPNWALNDEAKWVQSYAGAPITQGDQVIGFLNLYSDIPGFFTGEHVKRLESFADQAAIAIQNAQLFAAEREQRTLAEALRDTAAAVNSTLDFDEVVDRILENVGRVVAHDAANVMLIEEGVARYVRGYGYDERGLSDWVRSLRFQVSEVPVWQEMLRTGQPFAIPDTATNPNWLNIPEEAWIRSTVKAPIRREGEIIGVLHLDSTTPGFFDQDDAQRLQAFADQAAIAIRNAQLYDEIQLHAHDLEERVRARTVEVEAQRAQLQAILDAMGEGVVYTIGNKAIYVNQAFVDLLKFDASEMLFDTENVYRHMTSGIKNYDDQVGGAMRKAFARGKSWRGELRLRCKDDVEFDAALTITQVRHAGANDEDGTVTIFRDISQEKALQAQKDRFIANASHELRTPLANIKTRLYLVRRQPEKLDLHLQVLERVTDSMTDLIENLLDVSRFERGIISLTPRPVILQDLIREVITIQQPEAEGKNITMSAALPENPLVVSADSQRLTQVVTNLLTNALNYTPMGGQVVVELDEEPGEETQQAVIRVRDTGVGIPDEAKSQVFEPFFRTNETASTGTGLGLTIAQEIIERHGGTIEVESEVGKGSTFIVKLDLVVDKEQPRG
jgi:PAS domain S-box-containing protein